MSPIVAKARSETDKAKPAVSSASSGQACRRLRSLILLGNFGHISDTDHNSYV
jgi:hypothetical protein